MAQRAESISQMDSVIQDDDTTSQPAASGWDSELEERADAVSYVATFPSAKFGADILNPLFLCCINSLAPTDEISIYSFAESQTDTLIEEEERDAPQWRFSTITLTPPTASVSRGASTSNSRNTNAQRQTTGIEGNTTTRRTGATAPERFLTKDELKEAERMKRLMEQRKQRERARAVMMKKKELAANKEWEGGMGGAWYTGC
jgi:hypothetical protein